MGCAPRRLLPAAPLRSGLTPRARAAYEVAVIFDGLDNFKGYMESDFRTENMEPALAKAKELFEGDVYMGNRVYDEL